MRRRNLMRLGIGAVLVVLVLLLGGCIRQEVALLENERWEVQIEMTFSSQMVDMIGGEEQLRSTEEEVRQSQAEFAAQGVHAEVKLEKQSNGDYILRAKTNGQGWDLLNRSAFQSQATIQVLDNGHVKFSFDPRRGELGANLPPDMKVLTFVLKAKEIHSSNADRVEGGSAIWENIKQYEAEVTPGVAGGFPVWLIVVLVVVAVLAIGVALFLVFGRRKKPAEA